MYKRTDISNKLVLELLKKHGGNVNKVSQILNCSYRLVHDISTGNRTDPSLLPINKNSRSLKPPIEEVCTCCGFRPKMRGNRFLCDFCFRNGDEAYDEYAVSPECSLFH